jgi:hypothetical protein
MSAGERVHCVGVVRLITGEVFGKQAVVEIHKGIEDADGDVYWAQLEELEVPWEQLKDTVGATDYKALLRIVEKLGTLTGKACKSLKKSRCVEFDDSKPRSKDGTPRLL